MSTTLHRTEPIRTPWFLKFLAVAAFLIPIGMMVNNTDFKIRTLITETVDLKQQTDDLRQQNRQTAEQLSQREEQIASLNKRIRQDETTRQELEIRIGALEKRESQLQEVAILLKEEIIVAEQEAKMLAMSYSRASEKLASLVSENEEAAYTLARENELLRTAARERDNQVLSLLTEVSTLNTELAFVKDERDELNGEILRVTARMRTMEADAATIMAAQNGDASTTAIP